MNARERRVWFALALLGALVVGLILAERVSARPPIPPNVLVAVRERWRPASSGSRPST